MVNAPGSNWWAFSGLNVKPVPEYTSFAFWDAEVSLHKKKEWEYLIARPPLQYKVKLKIGKIYCTELNPRHLFVALGSIEC